MLFFFWGGGVGGVCFFVLFVFFGGFFYFFFVFLYFWGGGGGCCLFLFLFFALILLNYCLVCFFVLFCLCAKPIFVGFMVKTIHESYKYNEIWCIPSIFTWTALLRTHHFFCIHVYSGSTLHKLRGHNLRYSSLYVNISGCIMKYAGEIHSTLMQKHVRVMGYGV